MRERGYDKIAFGETWSIDKPVLRGKKTANEPAKSRDSKKAEARGRKSDKKPGS